MENNNTQINTLEENNYIGYVAVSFFSSPRSYYFGVEENIYNEGDKVIVETVRGIELGQVTSPFKQIDEYKNDLGLKPILRKATENDVRTFESNKKDATFAMNFCKSEVERLGLDMHLTSCEYTLDKAKILISYLADERVDFRELLKVLASKLHTRIELRQINSRDKAKLVGGVGVCGLKLCCATFLNEFEGVSINKAKNQMLAINVPKLSGHCGKLLCCLQYEDEAYSEAKKLFPEIGSKLFIDKKEWKITGLNIISQTLKLEGDGDIINISLDDYKKYTGKGETKIEKAPEEIQQENNNQEEVKPNEERNNNHRHFKNRHFRYNKNKHHHNEEK